MSQPYAELMALCPALSCTPYTTSPRGNTDNIITFVQFEEDNVSSETQNLSSETRNDT